MIIDNRRDVSESIEHQSQVSGRRYQLPATTISGGPAMVDWYMNSPTHYH